jgi:hypothetical protein
MSLELYVADSRMRHDSIQNQNRFRLNLMRQNNFRIFKEQSFRCFYRRREATHAPHATHVSLHAPENKVGGASRDRTDDPLLAKQVLSQLSYGP